MVDLCTSSKSENTAKMPHLLADSAEGTPAVYTGITARILLQAADVGEEMAEQQKQ
jgi:hypothetical protein